MDSNDESINVRYEAFGTWIQEPDEEKVNPICFSFD